MNSNKGVRHFWEREELLPSNFIEVILRNVIFHNNEDDRPTKKARDVISEQFACEISYFFFIELFKIIKDSIN